MGNSGNDRKSRVGTKSEGYNAQWMRKSGMPKIKTLFSSEGRNFVNQVGESYLNLQKNAPTGNNPNPHKLTKNEYWARREGLDNWAEQGGKWRTGTGIVYNKKHNRTTRSAWDGGTIKK